MPYSERPPALVLPESREGRRYFNQYVVDEAKPQTKFCPDWKDSGTVVLASCDMDRPMDFNACLNRRSDGVRFNNWCYRCMAGYPFVKQHVYDAERPSDRAITVFDKPSR